MEDNFSDVLSKFSNILKDKDIDLNSVLSNKESTNNTTINDETNSNDTDNTDDSNNSFSNFNLDLETILKIKEFLNAMNKNKHSPRNNLLLALKPYLENDKKTKLEQYMKIANLLTVLENFDTNSKIKLNESNYDFVLIITLFLLLF